MSNNYKLTNVTYLQGENKNNVATQNKLLGKKCKILFVNFGKGGSLQFESTEKGYLNLSAVQKIECTNTGIAITTLNSIYYLERVS